MDGYKNCKSNLLLIFQLTEFGCHGQLGVSATLRVAKKGDNQDVEVVTHHYMAEDTARETKVNLKDAEPKFNVQVNLVKTTCQSSQTPWIILHVLFGFC
jgi:hypothetical protein